MSDASTILDNYLIENIPYHEITDSDMEDTEVLSETEDCQTYTIIEKQYPTDLNDDQICYCNTNSDCNSNIGSPMGLNGCQPHQKEDHYVTIINPPHALYATGYNQLSGTQLEYRCEGHRGIVETSNEENGNYFDSNLKTGKIINRTNISKIFEKLHDEITARLRHKFYSELDKPE